MQIAIPASIELIGDCCFSHCEWICEITFPNGSQVRRLEASAFEGCSSLRRIAVPASVEVIGKFCFSSCSSLNAVVVEGDSCLREIQGHAFWRCGALKSLFIPKTVEMIDPSAFYQSGVESMIIDEANSCFIFDQGLLLNHVRTQLILSVSFRECISIPDTVATISDSCFSENTLLVAIQIPKTIEVIPRHCFFNCSALSTFCVESGSRLHRIEQGAFSSCCSLIQIIVPSSVELLGASCFEHCSSLRVMTFAPDSRLKQIGEAAFGGCRSLTKFELPQSVEVICFKAFTYCSSLSEFCVPRDSRLERIEGGCFCACSALLAFRIPASIQFIGDEAFPRGSTFEVECPNHENPVREWCVQCLLNPQSILDLGSLPISHELEDPVFDLHNYHWAYEIGKGAFGHVDCYKHKATNASIAVKSVVLKDGDIIDGVVDEKIIREVQLLKRFSNPCIVPVLGYHVQDDPAILRIAMPYVGRDSLKSVLRSPQNHPWLSMTSKTIIIVGIVIGMHFIHSGAIIHRDLKPENVLLDTISHYPKIADFGLSRETAANAPMATGTTSPVLTDPGMDKSMAMTGPVGSPVYMAPEIIAGRPYSSKADVFSFGVLLYEVATSKQPGENCGEDTLYTFYEKVIAGRRETIPDTVEAFTASLIRRCWDDDPHNRPTFLEIFDELRKNHFNIFSAVGTNAVERYLRSLT
jgi:hypothetical protein